MKPTLVFKTHLFPTASETFVVSNVVAAITMGYDVKIIADRINPIQEGSQAALLEKHEVMRFVATITPPQHKLKRLFKAFQYVLHPMLLYYFIKYCATVSKVSLSYLFILKFYSNYRNTDVFHIHFATNATDISILKRIGYLRAKVLVTFHGFDAHYNNDLEKEAVINRYKPWYSVWDKVTVNTLFLKQQVLSLGYPETGISVVPMAIDLEFYSPIIYPKTINNRETYRLISVGRLVPVKGHQYGIEAVKKLVDNGYDIKYTILGYGFLHEALASQIKALNLEQHVFLYGQATQEEIKQELEQAHLFLMTSIKDATGREETQGVVTAEAQAMGLPVVGFNSGGIPHTVTDKTSILVAQKNSDALAKAVSTLLEDKEMYYTMSLEAKIWAHATFGLPKMIARYYQDLI
ncbi:glycosyltransferase [Lacinutrix neustonica]|uniref:Glycosyltransferase n=1 Tax=Lacinutrix neustonica TaxID=2980107 RepID=A0A9E8SE51_9FLAO|nr:glycosyltransferase [Lacinutrix neustonica]WAC01939.1 glycosyltransferase [Lacinutrix neustonica]